MVRGVSTFGTSPSGNGVKDLPCLISFGHSANRTGLRFNKKFVDSMEIEAADPRLTMVRKTFNPRI